MRSAVLVVVVALFAASCSSGSGDGSLTVYSGRSEDLVQPLIDRFEEETGIDVTVRYADSASLAATILEEGDSSPADVFFAQDPASLGTVALDGLFSTLPDDVRGLVPARFSDREGAWVGVSGRARVVIYDTTAVNPDELPETEDGFVDPVWEGRVAVAPTNGSFLAFVAARILIDGEDATRSWLAGIAANGSPTFPSNSAIVTAVNDGQVETGLVNHYYLLRALAENPGVPGANYFFAVATAGSIVMPAGVGILASAANPDAARAFVDFLLEEGAQEYFATETFEYPLIAGVPAPEVLPPLDSLQTPDIDLSQLATTLDLATDLVAEAGLL
ncbi:MAG TPA: iron ABC transporter substrate-binding protein [Acidimicrobiia bacterium]|nr:iron ABC transporter substrate-binding protein [Acidimicrobiia bacterium]